MFATKPYVHKWSWSRVEVAIHGALDVVVAVEAMARLVESELELAHSRERLLKRGAPGGSAGREGHRGHQQ